MTIKILRCRTCSRQELFRRPNIRVPDWEQISPSGILDENLSERYGEEVYVFQGYCPDDKLEQTL